MRWNSLVSLQAVTQRIVNEIEDFRENLGPKLSKKQTEN